MAAREHYASSSAAEVSTTSNSSWKPVVDLAFTPAAGRDYVVFWSFEGLNITSTNSRMRFRVSQDGAAAAAGVAESRVTSEYPAYGGFFRLTGGGVATTLAVEIQNENNSATIVGRNGNLTALALTADDRYVEALPRVGVPSAAFATLASVSWAPGAGDYLVLGSTFVDMFATTAPAYARLQFDGASAPEQGAGAADVTAGNPDVIPLGATWFRAVASGGAARTASFQGRSHSGAGETGYRDTRLLVLSLGGFHAAHHGEVAALSGGTEASFTNVLTVAGAASANPHLVLATWSSSATSGAATGSVRVTDGGTQIGLGVRRSIAGATDRGVFGGLFTVRGGHEAGARSWGLDRRSHDGATTFNIMPGATLAALDLGAAGGGLPAEAGAFLETGAGARLAAGRRLGALAGAWRAGGAEAAFRRTYGLSAAPAVAAVGGPAARLTYVGADIWTRRAVTPEAWDGRPPPETEWRVRAVTEETWT